MTVIETLRAAFARRREQLPAVRLLELKPGDHLVLTVPGTCSPEEREGLKALLDRADFLNGSRVIVLERGMSLEVLRGDTQ